MMVTSARIRISSAVTQCFPRVLGLSPLDKDSIIRQHVRWKKIKHRKPLDPQHADDIQEFQYVGSRSKPDTLLYVWGVADHGGLGRPSFVRPDPKKRQHHMAYRYSPHRLNFGEYYKVVDIACGYGFTVFAVEDCEQASCFGTGLNTDCQIGTQEPRQGNPLGMLIAPAPIEVPLNKSSNILKVACGRAHTVMLSDNAEVWTVGNNAYGQCGRPVITSEDYSKGGVYHRLQELSGLQIHQIECGQDTSFFLSKDGVVYSCGWGADGQTGRGHYNNEPRVGPVVGDIVGENIVKVSCRADCALALNDKGDVFGWGNNEYHQLGSITDEMQMHTAKKLHLPDVGRIIDIASSGTMCLVLNEYGQVFSWGFGVLGKGPNVSFSRTPTLIPSTLFGQTQLTPDAKVTNIYCGINIFAAVNNYNSLFTWGKNPGGCLGLRHLKDQYFPFRVALMGQILKVSCGIDHMAALVRELI
ncbi:Williams-Beuren syndrome chromosome region 16 protein [Halocaridina rubra]|uniref:Williams-Beuren syndrome chromosome region 16 protein n=1 Tax=Halocaridina rubra TaxID=373956 RepID=A0AAN9A883_HALRR